MTTGVNLLKGFQREGGPAQDAVFAGHDTAAGLHISADKLRGDIAARDILCERLCDNFGNVFSGDHGWLWFQRH